jgi:hypothetical protein
VLLWAPIHLIHRLAPTPLPLVTGVGDDVHAVDAEFFDQHLRRAPLCEPSPAPEEARARGLRPEYRTAGQVR